MIKVSLNGDQMALINIGLSRRIIPIPEKGEILTGESGISGSLSFYFAEKYYGELFNILKSKCESGEFIKSNAESLWTSLLTALSRGIHVNEEEIEEGKEYFHLSMYM